MKEKSVYKDLAEKVIHDFYDKGSSAKLCEACKVDPDSVAEEIFIMNKKLISKGNSKIYTQFCDKHELAEKMYAVDVLDLELYRGKFDYLEFERQLEEGYSVF